MKTTTFTSLKMKTLAAMALLLVSAHASAQVFSSGGGDSTDYKSTIGYQNIATGKYSLAAGYHNTAASQSSIALGHLSKAEGLCSVAIGMYTYSQADYGITIGSGYSNSKPLLNNTSGIMFGTGSNVPTLFISARGSEDYTGKVGIGNVTDPQAKLHIKGDALEDADILLVSSAPFKSAIRFRNDDNSISLEPNNVMRINALTTYLMIDAPKVCFGSATTFLSNTDDEVFSVKAPKTIAQEAKTILLSGSSEIGLQSESIALTGKVGINTTNTTADYALAVDGGIITTKVFIQDVEAWPDYVFGDNYKLLPLHELKKFIGENRHLPDMPSEGEVIGQGYDLNEMQHILLKKIEELTLYTLQQQEEIEALRKTVEELKNK